MAIDFPKDRPEAGLGTGPLQNGDVWRNNSIDYTWVVSSSGRGYWSSRGINVDPDAFIKTTDQFGGVVKGTYDNLELDHSKEIKANALENKLILRFTDPDGNIRTTEYDGTQQETFDFRDTAGGSTVIQVTDGDGIETSPTDTGIKVSVKSEVAKNDGSNYAVDYAGNPLKVFEANSANTANNSVNALNLNNLPGSSYATTQYVDNAINSLPAAPEYQVPTLNDVVTEGNQVVGSDIILSDNSTETQLEPQGVKVRRLNNTSTAEIVPGTISISGNSPEITLDDFVGEGKIFTNNGDLYLQSDGKIYGYTTDGFFDLTQGGGGGGGTVVAGVSSITSGSSNVTITSSGDGGTGNVQISVAGGTGTGGTPGLDQVLNQDWQVRDDDPNNPNNAKIRLSRSQGTFDSKVVVRGDVGKIELLRDNSGAGDGPYIDFTRNRFIDYQCRIQQEGNDFILTSLNGNVKVRDKDNSLFTLTPSSDSGDVDLSGLVEEAPNDGRLYGRQSLDWEVINTTPDLQPANADGDYVRSKQGNTLSWKALPTLPDDLIDVSSLGADMHWDSLPGDTDDQKFADFVSRVNNNTADSLFVPGGVDIVLTQQYTFNNKVAFVGPSAALGKNLPGIVCAHNQEIGIYAPNGIRARNFKFDGGSKSDSSQSPTVLVFAGGNNSSGNQDDTDSSFRRCEFGEKAGGYALQINGRNANIGDCAFSNLTNGATCVKLEWRGIQPDASDSKDAELETSWRKNRIYDNQFHTNNGTTAIEIDGEYEIRGLIISNNIVDIGAIFLRVLCGVQGLTFTGNTWYGRRPGEQGVIKFENGAIRSATISGNTFSGFRDNTGIPNNFIRVSAAVNIRGLSITGNSFSYCDNRAISIDDPSDATRTTVVGNTFVSVNGGGAGWTSDCVEAANIITTN